MFLKKEIMTLVDLRSEERERIRERRCACVVHVVFR